jgi:hypothetical protein
MKYKLIPELTSKQVNRFYQNIQLQTSGCIEWVGGKMTDGRGRIKLKGKLYLISRIAYFIFNSVDPKEWQVCHTCDNPPCVNPEHLFLGTAADNMKDKALKMRGATKLTPDLVIEIRQLRTEGYSYGKLSQKFGVQKSALWKIANNQDWKWV